ncbi:MAG TPA: hypothetical protein VHK22_06940 [Gaiellaceae bacterium]|jgi:hypothetical protein|nr:hypothetical protein [Gaiellaceae bacterium]
MDPTHERTSEPEPSEPERLTAPAGAPRDSGGVELDIGPRVTAVFTAAEKAAQHIVDMAREEAEDVRRRAEAEVETYLTQRRYQAEEDAARLVAEARVQADHIRSAAEEAARQTEEAARRREVRIREETRLLEERVEWARDGLREVADRLREAEALVTIPSAEPTRSTPPPAPPPPRADVPPAATLSGAEPAGVEPGDELVEPSEAPEQPSRQPW